MNFRYLMAASVAVVSLGLSFSVSAQSKDSLDTFEAINPEVLFKSIIREDDVTLLFRHLRESMAASARGEEAQPSEAMQRRTEQIQREIAVRGSVLVSMLLTAFEQAAKQAVREGLGEFASKPAMPRGRVNPRSSDID